MSHAFAFTDGAALTRRPLAGLSVPIDVVQKSGSEIRFETKAANVIYKGRLNAAGNRIQGTWNRSGSGPLELVRGKSGSTEKPPNIAKMSPQQVEALRPLLNAAVSIQPVPFRGSDNSMHLIYEVNLTNRTSLELHIQRLEVLDGPQSLANFENERLNRVLTGDDDPKPGDYRKLEPRKHTVAFLSFPLSNEVAPRQLRHRITVDGYAIEDSGFNVSQRPPTLIGPPLRGSNWRVCCYANETHRHAATKVDGVEQYSQRFAIDWMQVGTDGETFAGDPANNRNYFAYGKETLAVADGVIVDIRDGVAENTPGKVKYPSSYKLPGVNILVDAIAQPFADAGNHVVIDLGNGQYAQYAHLQPGTLRVKIGDRVQRGQVLGVIGNSGRSTEPHLHFQIADGISFHKSEGLPYAIDSYQTLVEAAWEIRNSAMPMMGDRVRFP